MNLLSRLQKVFSISESFFIKAPFLVTPISSFICPSYLSRKSLYQAISTYAPQIYGDILDFGCGEKPYQSLFANAKSYLGVDIEVSGHNHKGSKVDIFYNGHTLPFEDEAFDCIVSFEAFEHIFNLENILNELYRVLKPQGLLLISIPFAWNEHEEPYDFARYTSFGIKFLLKTHNFDILALTKTNSTLLAIFNIFIEYMARNIYPHNKLFRLITHIAFGLPLIIIAQLLNTLLPTSYEYYSNIVILAIKPSAFQLQPSR